MKQKGLRVGSEWSTCPYCSEPLSTDHGPGCPFLSPSARFLCRWCGIHLNTPTPHRLGCPSTTHLFPVSRVEEDLTCGLCSSPFLPGDCFCLTIAGRTCLGCGWAHSAEA